MNPTRRALFAAPLLLTAAAPAKTPLAAVPISRLDTPWWRARHLEKLAELRRGRIDLVFLGDSITQDWERSGPPWGDFRPGWQRYYGDRHAINLGFSGDATSHLLWRLRNGEIDGIAPRLAVILIGANNLGRVHWPVEDNVQGIETVVDETLRRLPQTQVLLLGVLPSERSDWASQSTLAINRTLAARFGSRAVPRVHYLDIGGVLLRQGAIDRTMFFDPQLSPPEPPLHPSVQGQERLAAAMEPTVAALLGDRDHSRG